MKNLALIMSLAAIAISLINLFVVFNVKNEQLVLVEQVAQIVQPDGFIRKAEHKGSSVRKDGPVLRGRSIEEMTDRINRASDKIKASTPERQERLNKL